MSMIIPNSEIEYKGYVIGLCSGLDCDGPFFEGYYRPIGASKGEEFYTENNFWPSASAAYSGVKAMCANPQTDV